MNETGYTMINKQENKKLNRINRRILVTGITSIHGWPVWKSLKMAYPEQNLRGIRPPKMKVPDESNVISLCITDKSRIEKFVKDFNPTHVIHCSGVCDLDVCEERPQWAFDINVGGTINIAQLFGNHTHIIYLSTDLVFSGNYPPIMGYHENIPPDPISIAGKTFAQAEQIIKRCTSFCIIRLGLPVGPSITGDKGGQDWIASRFKKNLPVTLFYDEWRSCIPCDSIGQAVLMSLDKDLTGLFHLGGKEPIDLHSLGKWVRDKGNYAKGLLSGISRSQEKNGPPRIGNVALDSTKLVNILGLSLPSLV